MVGLIHSCFGSYGPELSFTKIMTASNDTTTFNRRHNAVLRKCAVRWATGLVTCGAACYFLAGLKIF
jgi:hypothetical protein